MQGTLSGNSEGVYFDSISRPFENKTTMAVRIRFLTPIYEEWTARLRMRGFDDDESLPGALTRTWISCHADSTTTVTLQGCDPNNNLEGLHKYKLKDDFEILKEVVLVLQRDDDPDDNMKIRFEHNLIVNGKRIFNVKRSILKSSEMINKCRFANCAVDVYCEMEEGISKDFLFEVTDLGNEIY